MKYKVISIISILFAVNTFGQLTNPNPPSEPVKLVMMHASIGRAWLCNGTNYGNLGDTLGVNNYYVSDLDKDWDAPENSLVFWNDYDSRGTHPGHIYTWFCDTTIQGNGISKSDNIMNSIYNADHGCSVYYPDMLYKRDYITNPGGENTVILFKPSHVASSVKDGSNGDNWTSLIGKIASSSSYTLPNAKELYIRMVEYFKTKPNKMFVLITPPPFPAQSSEDSDVGHAANARELNNWLVHDWLQDLGHENKNVYVFDMFNVFTGTDNHHHVIGNSDSYAIEHVVAQGTSNFGYAGYYVDPSDPHPGSGGNEGSAGVKATEEFVPLLNVFYNRHQAWLGNTSTDIYKSKINTRTTMSLNGTSVNYSIPASKFNKGFKLLIHTLSGKSIDIISLNKNKGVVNLSKVTKAGLSSGQYILTIESDKNVNLLSERFNFIKK